MPCAWRWNLHVLDILLKMLNHTINLNNTSIAHLHCYEVSLSFNRVQRFFEFQCVQFLDIATSMRVTPSIKNPWGSMMGKYRRTMNVHAYIHVCICVIVCECVCVYNHACVLECMCVCGIWFTSASKTSLRSWKIQRQFQHFTAPIASYIVFWLTTALFWKERNCVRRPPISGPKNSLQTKSYDVDCLYWLFRSEFDYSP